MLRNNVGGGMPSKYKTIELEGDLDLFGDHSIEIHRTVSHTPGSQIMVVRLPKSGTAVLTSDAVYLQENLDKNILPSIGSVYNPPACSMPTPGLGGCAMPKAPTYSWRTIRMASRRRSTRRNSTSKQPDARLMFQTRAMRPGCARAARRAIVCGMCESGKLMSPVVLAQHVTKWYGPRRAVADVSFAIEQGEIVGLLGPNGSGKSTIFRILTGYLAPTSGRIEVAGHDVVTDSLAVDERSATCRKMRRSTTTCRGEFLHFIARIKGLRGAAKK